MDKNNLANWFQKELIKDKKEIINHKKNLIHEIKNAGVKGIFYKSKKKEKKDSIWMKLKKILSF